jgi:glycosyltransferase involved in cell wall biosynthesis
MEPNLQPVVTILITAFNAEKHIAETIESVLNQTFQDFELLIIDDGSTDSTCAQILEFSDVRIRLVRNEKNEGLTPSLNKGIVHSRAKYIARLDADDIALPTRLRKQVAFMEANSNVGLCGTFAEIFGTETGILKSPEADGEISVDLCFFNCFVHSSVMIRRSILDQYKLSYRLPFCEDYDLWCQISRVSQVYNIPEILVRYRKHAQQMTNVHLSKYVEFKDEVIGTYLNTLFEDVIDLDVLQFIYKTIVHPEEEPEYAKILDAVKKLNHYNDKHRVRDGAVFLKGLKNKIVLHQMCATKKFHFSDFILIMRAHLRPLYEILGFRYATKLIFYTFVAKRRK